MDPNDTIRQAFADAGQEQVFRFWGELNADQRQRLVSQAKSIDLDEVARLHRELIAGANGDGSAATGDQLIEPAPWIAVPSGDDRFRDWQQAKVRGEEAILAGRVAAFTVAGGQGTRLGFDGPKGAFPVTPVTGKPLFQVFAEKLRATERRYGHPIGWWIMTSDLNHEATVKLFAEHYHFGLDPQQVRMFRQGLMPAVDHAGKILLAAKDQIAMSPDGHGGSLRALVRSGAVEAMRERGIDLLSYFQVDNPLVRCVDPEFIGFHLLRGSEMSSKAVLKTDPAEKVGVFAQVDGVLQVVEYSDLRDDLAAARDDDGGLRFRAGNIAIHVLNLDLVARLGGSDDPAERLPFHRADKKVPCLDDSGRLVEPDQPNAVKFEMFVFDALTFARNPLVVETPREREFSPVKNATGSDSPETSKADQLRQFARWFRAAGLEMPVDQTGLPDMPVEVSPLFADSMESFQQHWRALVSPPVLQPGMVLDEQ